MRRLTSHQGRVLELGGKAQCVIVIARIPNLWDTYSLDRLDWEGVSYISVGENSSDEGHAGTMNALCVFWCWDGDHNPCKWQDLKSLCSTVEICTS